MSVIKRVARVEGVGKVSVYLVLDQFSQHLCNRKEARDREEYPALRLGAVGSAIPMNAGLLRGSSIKY
jgi:hypothetical protein